MDLVYEYYTKYRFFENSDQYKLWRDLIYAMKIEWKFFKKVNGNITTAAFKQNPRAYSRKQCWPRITLQDTFSIQGQGEKILA